MNKQHNEGPVSAAVILVVPKRHVKTVKSALEQFGFLDQSLKIAPETRRQGSDKSDIVTGEQEHDSYARNESVRTSPPDSGTTATSQALLQDSGAAGSFPRLEFDSSSGQYVDPAVLRENKEQEEAAASGQFPILKFDSITGQYVEPSVLEMREKQELEIGASPIPQVSPENVGATNQFPVLQFDFISGRYVDRSVLEERRHQKELEATDRFPILEFDSVSGQYVEPSVVREEKERGSGIEDERMRIPTTFPYPLDTNTAARNEDEHELKSKILEDIGLNHLFRDITISYRALSSSEDSATRLNNPLHQALKAALVALPETMLSSLELTTSLLVSSFPDAYSVYKPLLLLSNHAFSSSSWSKLLSTHSTNSDLLQRIWQRIAAAVGATHVAINSPIPLHTPNELFSSAEAQHNILRSPTDLRPIYGDFGPSPTPQTLSSPTPSDFASTIWVTTIQNGIQQTWAPRYTMFSRGNIREKTRILNLPSVTSCFDAPYAAIDLYAGIGYFAFSYKKGGQQDIRKVLCWELNPWSVEGLRRGAEINGWSCRVFTDNHLTRAEFEGDSFRTELESSKDTDFWIFQTSNEHAERIIRSFNGHGTPLIPPIRHINLGLLPSSTLSWPTAVRILDAERGGWIHAHENVGAKEIVARTREVASEFQKFLKEEEGEGVGKRRRVVVEHVEKVKTYAPGVVHVVFDVRIEGRKTVDV